MDILYQGKGRKETGALKYVHDLGGPQTFAGTESRPGEAPSAWEVNPSQQVQQRRFPAATGADQRYTVTGVDRARCLSHCLGARAP